MQLRPATVADLDRILAIDAIAPGAADRTNSLRAWLARGGTIIAEEPGGVVGYAVVERSFFERGFLRMLYVAPAARRRGVGRALLHQAELDCPTRRLFTSTNRSNTAMQALLQGSGYTRCGEVTGLDEDDPEVFYWKDV